MWHGAKNVRHLSDRCCFETKYQAETGVETDVCQAETETVVCLEARYQAEAGVETDFWQAETETEAKYQANGGKDLCLLYQATGDSGNLHQARTKATTGDFKLYQDGIKTDCYQANPKGDDTKATSGDFEFYQDGIETNARTGGDFKLYQ